MRHPGGAKIGLDVRRQRALVAEYDGQENRIVRRRQTPGCLSAQFLPPAFQGARQTKTVCPAQQMQPFRVRDATHCMNAPPLHQAPEVERPRIARSAWTMQPQPVHSYDVAGQIRQAVRVHVDADQPADRLPRLLQTLQTVQAQIHELAIATRHHGTVNDALDVPALGLLRQLVRHVLRRQRQAVPAEMQRG